MVKYSAEQWRRCKRKTPHGTADEAAQEAKQAERDFQSRMTIYPCPYGDHWHVAHAKETELLSEHAELQRELDQLIQYAENVGAHQELKRRGLLGHPEQDRILGRKRKKLAASKRAFLRKLELKFRTAQ